MKTLFKFLFIIILLSSNLIVYSQNAGYTTCGSVVACPGTYITVPITISGSPQLRGISMRIDYDGDVLSYMAPGGGTPLNPPFSSLNVGLYYAFGNIMSNQNWISPNNYRNVKIPWGGMGGLGTVTTNGTGLLFNLIFYYYGGTTTLHFNNSSQHGGDCEYAGANYIALNDSNPNNLPYYIDGGVSPTPSSISGIFTYDNIYGTPLDSLHVTLLKTPYNYPNDTVATMWTDINGNYGFPKFRKLKMQLQI